ncbi:MAG: porphobilinogen synthase [Alphaproteobacteria bacterium]
MPDRPHAAFPHARPRRLRQAPWIRDLVRESRLSPHDLIWPLFVIEGENVEQAIPSMPGVARLSVDRAVAAARRATAAGIPMLALFPAIDPGLRTEDAREALKPDNLVCRAAMAIKDAVPEIGLMGDVALDPYTSHGHDGVMEGGRIVNDPSVDVLCAQALTLARAGFDVIAPSDMMDGRVGRIRSALDGAGFQNRMIMAYAAKYASGFYGPFRDALGSTRALIGDKRTYQMDPGNGDEALYEIGLDLAEGADMIMIKPGLPYLDIVRRAKERFGAPTFAYQVSGEYAMLAAACANGWLDRERVVPEALLAFKRAGADGILTYFALEAAERLAAGG